MPAELSGLPRDAVQTVSAPMDPDHDWGTIVEVSSTLGLDLKPTNLLRNDLLT